MSVVDCIIAPSRTSSRRSDSPLVRLPLWPTAKPPAFELGEQRLHVAQDGGAGGGIADVADRDSAGQALDHLAAGEGVADEAEPALAVEAAAVEGDDAGGFLAAMLQGVQAERGDGGGFGVAEDAEHAAFFAQRVAFEIVLRVDRGLAEFCIDRSGTTGLESAGLSFQVDIAQVLDRVGRDRKGYASRPSPLSKGFAHLAAGFSISFLSCRGQVCCSHRRARRGPVRRQFARLQAYSS